MKEWVLSFEDALSAVLEQCRSRAAGRTLISEEIALLDVLGRVLAEAVVADRDQPPFGRSTRDGFAVRAHDLGQSLQVVGCVKAGERWSGQAVAPGQAVEIMTGAPLPEGADAVVMVEHVVSAGGEIRLIAGRSLRVGENVVPQGTEARAGAQMLSAGTLMGAAEIAVAASCGRMSLPVVKRPNVSIVATGDELVDLDAAMEPWQIRNSNSYALAAMVRAEGGLPNRQTTAKDTREDLRKSIAESRLSDMLVLSGGVSMGRYDLVEEVLAEFGAEFFFTGALIQPGKPVVFGRLPKRDPENTWMYFFGLPGNPVSTQVTFALFVAPLLRALAGQAVTGPRFVEARLTEDVAGGARVTRFMPGQLDGAWNGVTVKVVNWQGSGDVAANARGNGYVVLPSGVDAFAAGETVRVLLR